jgi:CRP-like cAMP-binding protein
MGAVAKKKPAAKADQKKSGMMSLDAGDKLFNDGDPGGSLYIIQKGQLRLFKPKGKGFVEIAVLRAGEVIGEMAYFDEDGSGGKRSCSAEAMVKSQIIEISFTAFGKTMQSLNPWFKTIINTLATRLRATNKRIRELESNSLGYGEQAKQYVFLKEADLLRSLGTLFLVFNAHGEKKETGRTELHRKALDLYSKEIYSIMEAKFDAVINLLVNVAELEILNDDDNLPKLYSVKNVTYLRQLFIFLNSEKHLTDEKKLVIDRKCKVFLEEIELKIQKDNIVHPKEEKFVKVAVNEIIEDFKARNLPIDISDLDLAKKHALTNETYVGKDNQLELEVNVNKIVKMMPMVRFLDEYRRLNEKKQGS